MPNELKPERRPEMEQYVSMADETDRLQRAYRLVALEMERARRWPAMNSAHEGYAVLAEEVDELWEHVKVQQGKRDVPAMAYEAIQTAAMAIRFAVDVCRKDVANR